MDRFQLARACRDRLAEGHFRPRALAGEGGGISHEQGVQEEVIHLQSFTAPLKD